MTDDMESHQEEPKSPEDSQQQPEPLASPPENQATSTLPSDSDSLTARENTQAPDDWEASTVDATIDSVMAARLHNHEHSRLLKLPDELMLKILGSFNLDVAIDEAAVFCLSRVSEFLRRIIKSELKPVWLPIRNMVEPPFYLLRTPGVHNAIRYCLRKDLLCKTCLPRNDLRLTRDGRVVPRYTHGKRLWDYCKFESHHVKGIGPLYCSGCDAIHHHRMFSAAEREVKGSQRVCIMRTGVVWLCKHRAISWADIEPHAIDLLSKEPENVRVPCGQETQGIMGGHIDVPIMTCEYPEHKGSFSGKCTMVFDPYLNPWEDISYLSISSQDKDDWVCISLDNGLGAQLVRYGRDGKARLNPPHDWLHAMDPDSYQLDDDTRRFGNIWPVCKDSSCLNCHCPELARLPYCRTAGRAFTFDAYPHKPRPRSTRAW
ncbi:hypothetical protein QBC41DRAFT_230021 [Cercophora samala]|uniref:F-box domain-containing protein n=1 Tax=Cercophora samala TaxID=330535 RepID=A0AA39Z995_9PEZI|nr:hypothetical protein QBC41DRAFT_230021 [Cercophora samala]